MIRALMQRIQQKHRTVAWPKREPVLPDRLRGRPVIAPGLCAEDCRACAEACPTGAVIRDNAGVRIDLGRCLFCAECAAVCPREGIRFTGEYRMAARTAADLVLGTEEYRLAKALEDNSRKLFGRSLKLRQVCAGGCGACEADVNVLNTVVFDLGRFGIQFVASPRHADGLLITGPVPENMRLALLKTWEATPAPKLVIAVGACACSGGPYIGHPEVHNGCAGLVPVDLFVPGCPPHPMTILDGLVRLLGTAKLPRPA